ALLAGVGASTAAAHANLERSDPPADAVLDTSPPRLTLRFSEPLDPRFSEIQVLDAAGRRLDRGGASLDPADPLALTLPLDRLPDGIYTVGWKALSAVDGHVTRGGFAFTVGRGVVLTAPPQPPAAGDDWANATPAAVGARWLTYVTSLLLAGTVAFPPLVLLPAAAPRRRRRAPRGAARVDGSPGAAPPRRLVVLALLASALATLYAAWTQAAAAADVSLASALGRPLLDLLTATRSGLLCLARLALLALLGGLLVLPRRGDRAGERRWWWAGAALAALVLLTLSLNSHAAGEREGSGLSLAADWAHLAAASVWL